MKNEKYRFKDQDYAFLSPGTILAWQVIAIFLFNLIITQAMAGSSYNIRSIITFPEAVVYRECVSINDIGQVVCNIKTEHAIYPIIWQNDTKVPIIPPAGEIGMFNASGINNQGQIVGTATVLTVPASENDGSPIFSNNAYLWSRPDAVPVDITPKRFPHSFFNTYLMGTVGRMGNINNNGQAVGNYYDEIHGYNVPFVTNGINVVELSRLPVSWDNQDNYANDINDSGQIIGGSQADDGLMVPVTWELVGGSILILGRLSTVDHGYAASINNSGQIVGLSGARAVLWERSIQGGYEPRALGSLGQASCDFTDQATDNNDDGQIVGISSCRAFLWTETDGMLDLNSLVENPQGLIFDEGVSINNLGHILASYRTSSGQNGYAILQPKSAVETLELKAADSREKVWANGREQAELVATITDATGKKVAGRQIWLTADRVDGLTIKPDTAIVTTDSNGEAKFTATSTKIGAVNFTATDVQNQLLQSSKKLEFAERRVVVIVQGINSTLNSTNDAIIFPAIRDNFIALGFSRPSKGIPEISKPNACANASDDDQDDVVNDGCPLILNYSYNGGTTDRSTGMWRPFSYSKSDTNHFLAMSYTLLVTLMESFRIQNPNTRFILVGHSQGGLIAFQSIQLFLTNPQRFPIDAVITLDAALGGAPIFETAVARILTPWGFPATVGMLALWYSTNEHDRQGTTAKILSITNDDIAKLAQANGMKIMTVGSNDDCIWNPTRCLLLGHNNTSTQIVESANVQFLRDLKGNCPLTPSCVNSSHSQVQTDSQILLSINRFLVENGLLPFK